MYQKFIKQELTGEVIEKIYEADVWFESDLKKISEYCVANDYQPQTFKKLNREYYEVELLINFFKLYSFDFKKNEHSIDI